MTLTLVLGDTHKFEVVACFEVLRPTVCTPTSPSNAGRGFARVQLPLTRPGAMSMPQVRYETVRRLSPLAAALALGVAMLLTRGAFA